VTDWVAVVSVEVIWKVVIVSVNVTLSKFVVENVTEDVKLVEVVVVMVDVVDVSVSDEDEIEVVVVVETAEIIVNESGGGAGFIQAKIALAGQGTNNEMNILPANVLKYTQVVPLVIVTKRESVEQAAKREVK
jgi:hypothetical protein